MSNLLTAEILNVLKPQSGLHVIVTAGNSFRSDDGLGPYIASRLHSGAGLNIIDAGYTPENIVDEVIALQPHRIIVIDAANFGGSPGEIRIISEDKIPETTLSTHMIPLSVVMRIIQDSVQTEVFFIGIQSKTLALGEGLSQEVKQVADNLVDVVAKMYHLNERSA